MNWLLGSKLLLSFHPNLGFLNAVIDNEIKLAEFLPLARDAGWLAIDTEADSLHAYPEKLCLLQVSLPAGDFLIDPLAGLDLSQAFALLRKQTLILHGADYDLRLLHRTFGFVPSRIFDTMWAARLLGEKEFGLTALVAKFLGITLEKGPQKMDWARRPLTERMENYARNDTRHLKTLADLLRAELVQRDRLSWLEETCAQVIVDCAQGRPREPDQVWRLTGSDRLTPFGMAILRELWHWRETEAIAANKPPYFVLSHETLVSLAATLSRSKSPDPLIPPRMSPSRRSRLLEAIRKGLAVPSAEHPTSRRRTPNRLNRGEQQRFEAVKKLRDTEAAKLGIDPTVIAPKAAIVAVARDGASNGAGLLGWQKEILSRADGSPRES